MEIIEILDDKAREDLLKSLRERFRERFEEDNHLQRIFPTHFEAIINKPYCLKVNIFSFDYSKIFIASSIPGKPYYQTLLDAIAYINLNQNFLFQTRSECLSGIKVQEYLETFRKRSTDFQNCFIEMGDCIMQDSTDNPSIGNNVTDGMHRLVGYGLATEMNKNYFPIPIYFGTETMIGSHND